MPTILLVRGWRFFFFANESSEPPHIHVEKAEVIGKFWLDAEERRIEESYFHRGKPAQRREVLEIIEDHFDLLVESWNKYHL